MLYTSASSLDSQGGIRKSSDSNFAEASLGFAYEILEEGTSTSVSIASDLVVVDKNGFDRTDYFSGYTLSMSMYHTVDPVVFSLHSGWRHSSDRSVNGNKVEIPDTFFINPSLTFLVNPQVSMAFGPDIRYRNAPAVNNRPVDVTGTDMRGVFNITYAVSADSRFFSKQLLT
ncbi:hypothetical protein [Tamilnaduibacter salinus]|uniref:hypothetical protein n=1 Tax=Tamilnaduibacter salinus TaxID=1484056 RepID=UPI00117F62D9|nr:hypothetical protein [Tamilnaduibacter salinus]